MAKSKRKTKSKSKPKSRRKLPKKRTSTPARSVSRKPRRFDNPLFQSTLHEPSPEVATAVAAAEAPVAEVKPERSPVPRRLRKAVKSDAIMSPDEEKASVFEIITDLERQLDAAFSIKSSQEKEIAKIKDDLDNEKRKTVTLDAKVSELNEMLISQEELNSELEFLENERLETIEKVRSLEEEIQKKVLENEKIEEQAEVLNKDNEARRTRMEQIEYELNNTHTATQNFQNQIFRLEEEKEQLANTLQSTEEEVLSLNKENDALKQELNTAKENLDEIRLMLADTRSKARARYYTKKKKS